MGCASSLPESHDDRQNQPNQRIEIYRATTRQRAEEYRDKGDPSAITMRHNAVSQGGDFHSKNVPTSYWTTDKQYAKYGIKGADTVLVHEVPAGWEQRYTNHTFAEPDEAWQETVYHNRSGRPMPKKLKGLANRDMIQGPISNAHSKAFNGSTRPPPQAYKPYSTQVAIRGQALQDLSRSKRQIRQDSKDAKESKKERDAYRAAMAQSYK